MYQKIDKNFFYSNGKPLHGSVKLCEELAKLCNKKKKYTSQMSREELQELVKPAYERSGVTWLEDQ